MGRNTGTFTAMRRLLDDSTYEPITIYVFKYSHDSFLCIDDGVSHVGASIKDLGKKWFAFSKMEDLNKNEQIGKINGAY